jgi:predicted regulator of Ras-like GTPase activity (Roadblock/LC7/MglB family)
MTQDRIAPTKDLVFYEEEIKQIEELLDNFIKQSGAKCTFLVDQNGYLISKKGFTSSFNGETISALVAGSFAATKEVAKLLGESEFSVLFHQGKRDSIQMCLIENRAILAILFDERTTIGMIRLYAKQTGDELTKLFHNLHDRSQDVELNPEEKEKMNSDKQEFIDQTGTQMDNLFNIP